MNRTQPDPPMQGDVHSIFVEVIEHRDVLAAYVCSMEQPVAQLCGTETGNPRPEYDYAILRHDVVRLA